MSKQTLNITAALAPVPLILVSCGNMESSNIISIAWTGIISSPLIYVSIRPERYSHEIIKNSKEFVINMPNEKLVEAVKFCGKNSGRDVNKFKELNLTKVAGSKVSVPLIKECAVNLECKLVEIKSVGAHDMFIGEIVSISTDEEYLNEDGKMDYERLSPLAYVGGDYYSLGSKIS